MAFFANEPVKGSQTIAKALQLFTTAQDELTKGIDQSKIEAEEITTKISTLNTELTDVNTAAQKAQKVHDNISKLLDS